MIFLKTINNLFTGLLMLFGLIMFISIFKAEIGSKLLPRYQFHAPLFTFKYGQSFVLYVVGFILTEFSGILNVFLFTALHDEMLLFDNTNAQVMFFNNKNLIRYLLK